MRKRTVASIAFTGAAVVAGTGFTAHAAQAASTGKWTVKNLTFTATAGTTHLTALNSTGTHAKVDELTCTTAAAKGKISHSTFTQSGNASFKAGTTSGTFGSTNKACSSSKGFGLKFTAKFTGTLDAATNSKGVTHGMITGITAQITGTGIIGCSATFKGAQPYKYTNSTGKLVVSGAATNASKLKTTSVSGCGGLLKVGQWNFFNGSYTAAAPAPSNTRAPAN